MKLNIIILLILFFGNNLLSQTIKGVILNKSQEPIEDAYVFTTKGNTFSLSNRIGQFELTDIVVGDSLNVSFLGFKTLQYAVKKEDFSNDVKLVLEDASIDLGQITVSNSTTTLNTITTLDLKTNPVNSSQEVLQKIPGLFIAQHAGGGKAEQIFLRGFDIDHGTDIAITVDGMPVNMVSHAHGQGYADLHFLIPETIDKIDFGKGPYQANQGNFATAGHVNFKTKDRIENNSIGLEYGQFNTFRGFGQLGLMNNVDNQDAYVAAEYLLTDGPFESPQDFKRLNVFGKYTYYLNESDRLSFQLSHFKSDWTASGQIPQRLVDNGTITRFGSVDDTEGGDTQRNNLGLSYTKVVNDNIFIQSNAYYTYYDFELFSNFTFFLEDPINGDQIRQKESRNLFGLNTTIFHNINLQQSELELNYGIGVRHDDVNEVGLSHTLNRTNTIGQFTLGNVDESNYYGFVSANWRLGKWTINSGLRLDAFRFQYEDLLLEQPVVSDASRIFSAPKFNLIYNPNKQWQFYFKSGRGFHSNDAKVVVTKTGKEILPGGIGADIGLVWKPMDRLWINTALWSLVLEQEFVYVGDAGIVEPSGKSSRQGIDLNIRYQLTKHLFMNADINYNNASFVDEPDGQDRVPLAPEFTSVGGLTYQSPNGLNAGIRYRYIRDRPANEDNSIIADGYFIVDVNANYKFKNITVGVNIENLFNQEWNEAQFATESRLQDEPVSVEEIHFTPGVPFFIKGSINYQF